MLIPEESLDTNLKQDSVVFKKLWQIAVSQRSDQHDIFVLVRVLSLQRPSHHQHRLQSSHAKVVMVLLGELFRAQLVHLGHLLGQVLGGLETLGVQDHLSDETWEGNWKQNVNYNITVQFKVSFHDSANTSGGLGDDNSR